MKYTKSVFTITTTRGPPLQTDCSLLLTLESLQVVIDLKTFPHLHQDSCAVQQHESSLSFLLLSQQHRSLEKILASRGQSTSSETNSWYVDKQKMHQLRRRYMSTSIRRVLAAVPLVRRIDEKFYEVNEYIKLEVAQNWSSSTTTPNYELGPIGCSTCERID